MRKRATSTASLYRKCSLKTLAHTPVKHGMRQERLGLKHHLLFKVLISDLN